ncbi:isoprenyl transferase [Pleionea litopenaei]|uniref:Ditrans,polycis-undecaprenyl-diphosphate synthase ((2E,6E)-farnesyl-diphosphate specific) n=1 Tax=Pleionea litopenaei TaxID=3070815 RepID=A0AA51X665_9GAMM|nr:isoprenyl transferase [Pleionea sp. HL-JVS1]WMS86962.1 isoprenyl transferase [Pleionea sp. HL-JVS1]
MPQSQQSEQKIPQHIAIIMDGNGRWAQARGKKRVSGHKAGMDRAREMVEACGVMGVKVLTLFAFSSENWKRPEQEVGFLMNLFVTGLTRESKSLHKNNVQLRVIGDISRFDSKLQKAITSAEQLTADNDGIVLQIAANYGGQWDITNAVNKAMSERESASPLEPLTAEDISLHLSGADLPDPDLLIRTGGEVRISNFLLWQCAYSELYFSEALWPDFDTELLKQAVHEFGRRQRRYGQTGEQVDQADVATTSLGKK